MSKRLFWSVPTVLVSSLLALGSRADDAKPFSWSAPVVVVDGTHTTYDTGMVDELKFNDSAAGAHVLQVMSTQPLEKDTHGRLKSGIVVTRVVLDKQDLTALPAWRELGHRLQAADKKPTTPQSGVIVLLLCQRADEDHTSCPNGLPIDPRVEERKHQFVAGTEATKLDAKTPIVTDTKTKRVWQQVPDSQSRSWADAKTYCGTLGTDWRMPTVDELAPMLVPDLPAPGIQFKLGQYWTSSGVPDKTGHLWLVGTSNGAKVDLDESSVKHTSLVCCVR